MTREGSRHWSRRAGAACPPRLLRQGARRRRQAGRCSQAPQVRSGTARPAARPRPRTPPLAAAASLRNCCSRRRRADGWSTATPTAGCGRQRCNGPRRRSTRRSTPSPTDLGGLAHVPATPSPRGYSPTAATSSRCRSGWAPQGIVHARHLCASDGRRNRRSTPAAEDTHRRITTAAAAPEGPPRGHSRAPSQPETTVSSNAAAAAQTADLQG